MFPVKKAEKTQRNMETIPNHECRSCGYVIQEENRTEIPDSYYSLLESTMQYIGNRQFVERFHSYLKENERWFDPMMFRSERHEDLFCREARKPRNQSACMLTAIYLFSADNTLWRNAKYQLGNGVDKLLNLPLEGISITGYTLYKAALALCRGTDDLTISELADRDSISPLVFGIICEAMTLRRYGIAAVKAKGMDGNSLINAVMGKR
ncbi:MAG: hypothetical protein PHR18_04210 [Oscillospiraceae bacterium]|nr:hypothetical protein [Oscillospiraceae bacterium]